MKGFFDALKISAAIIGAMIGAGFITGAEIVRFFSGASLLPACVLLFVLMSLFVWALMAEGDCGQKALNLRVLGPFSKIVDVAVPLFSFMTLTCMCAALDALAASFFKVDPRIPLLSPLALLLSFFVCGKGVREVEKLNLVLVPAMIAVIVAACINSPYPQTSGKDVFPIYLYAGMNCFLSSPVIIGAGLGKSAKTRAAAALISSGVISVCVFFIMSKISSGAEVDSNLPLLSTIGVDGAMRAIFSIVTLFGILTTLVCSHYPLVCIFNKSGLKRTLNVVFGLLALLLSRVGFYNIVAAAYPIAGGAGLIYLTLVCARAVISLAPCNPLEKGHKRIHGRGKHAKN